MRTTMKDIAAKANVSIATVSYVINGKNSVSSQVEENIFRIIKELDYKPNKLAQRLAKNTNAQIGLYAPNIYYLEKSIFFSELIGGILKYIKKLDINLVVTTSSNESTDWIDYSNTVDGAILINPVEFESYSKKIVKSKIPLVLIGTPSVYEDKISYVDSDNYSITYKATKLLIENGHRNIGMFSGPAHYTVTLDQIKAYKKALSEFNIPFNSENVISDNYILSNRNEPVIKLINSDVTAILASSDNLAITVAKTVYSCGLRIPDDISIVCLAESYTTEYFHPSITGACLNSDTIGYKAAEMLINKIHAKSKETTHRLVDFEFHERESVKRIL